MDIKTDEKINNFSAAVLANAQKKRAETETENEKIKNKKLDEAQDVFYHEAFHKIQDSIEEIRKADNERVLQAQVSARRELFMKRDSIMEAVFDGVLSKLSDFMKTDEYRQWLEKKINESAGMLGNGDKTVFALESDIEVIQKIVNSIDKLSGDINVVKTQEDDFMGGVSVINNERGILVNYSFKELIAGQKSEFLQKSGLTIE